MADNYSWLPAYSVGIAVIDGQHRELLSLISQLHEAMLNRQSKSVMGDILAQLVEYTQVHFALEEALMAQYDYPGYQSHRKVHAEMRAKVLALSEDHASGRIVFSLKVMEFLKEWLTSHILGVDRMYKDFLHQEGVK